MLQSHFYTAGFAVYITLGAHMLPRVLLKNETWLMTIDWLGLGKLEVSHYPTSRNTIAPAWLKSHFINTMHALSTKGVSIGPSSPIALQAMETYAGFVLNPDDLMTRSALSQSSEQLAEAILLEGSSARSGPSDCRCFTPPFSYTDYVSEPIGIDMTNQRCGEVSLETCKHCGTKWLKYLVEYEAFTASGRWFRGLITDVQLATFDPQNAVPFLEQMPWHFVGGSYYSSRGQRSTGAIRADL